MSLLRMHFADTDIDYFSARSALFLFYAILWVWKSEMIRNLIDFWTHLWPENYDSITVSSFAGKKNRLTDFFGWEMAEITWHDRAQSDAESDWKRKQTNIRMHGGIIPPCQNAWVIEYDPFHHNHNIILVPYSMMIKTSNGVGMNSKTGNFFSPIMCKKWLKFLFFKLRIR